MQFGRILELPPNIRCLGVKEDILMDSQPSIRLLHQIDFPCWLSPSEFSVAENYDEDDTRCEYEIVVPRYEIPKWFNHQSVESSISFWIGLEFPTFALCLAFCLDQLTDKDTYSCVCVVHFPSMVINDCSYRDSFKIFSMIICGFMVHLIAYCSKNLET